VMFNGKSGHRGRVVTQRAQEQLGYQPAYTLRSALQEILSS